APRGWIVDLDRRLLAIVVAFVGARDDQRLAVVERDGGVLVAGLQHRAGLRESIRARIEDFRRRGDDAVHATAGDEHAAVAQSGQQRIGARLIQRADLREALALRIEDFRARKLTLS